MDHKAAGVLAGLTILALLSLYLSDFGVTAFFLIPLPFAFTASMSFNGFRKESLAGLVALPFVFLGSTFIVIALMVALGCPWASYQAKNIHNGKNELYTLFKAPLVAVTLLGVLISVTVVYSYQTDLDVRQMVERQTVESSMKFSSLTGGVMGGVQGKQVEFASEVARVAVLETRSIVFSEMNAAGAELTPYGAAALEKGFTDAEVEVPRDIKDQLETGSVSLSADDLKPLVAEQIRPLLAPSKWLYMVIFFTVMSVVWVVQIPFGIVCALYGRLVFRRAPFRSIYEG